MSQNYAIIVAGGSGTRMGTTVPKQFLSVNGLPVLMHTLLAFYNSASKPHLILALPKGFHDYWKQLCNTHNFNIDYILATGGETRFQSVKAAFELISDHNSLIAVHDAVRPLINSQLIDAAYQQAAETGNAIVAVKSRDSIRQLKNGLSASLKRDEIYLVQTPQIFQYKQLKRAYLQTYSDVFTDDASVVEAAGFKIHLIEGDNQNIKITFPEDIAIAELILKGREDAGS
ncbi:2-C-methyl-D-erythritol 4-phosphate cytidylyltransferase [Mucilaginibacter auburnensis]|uniref:2-C-methyl-D-erythritol 4-phosphate cytidylyltransferase n=1 Tax=Mucilaginibacter auburnensis TaxID=1457233 RepID=A0A2H9VUQ9_9SPHI|nr:2-C-methyl-D-erythritol 4-phosphate cytidylyltransferase [Mucilaginibacter auburnensis]PJJ84539.1 2-C-methyl-D-erythritol 4-phosphate cytidylyltransferase [Mucilaginibacter auburnensis]